MRKAAIFAAECLAFAIVCLIVEQIPWSKFFEYVRQGATVTSNGGSALRNTPTQPNLVSSEPGPGTTERGRSPDQDSNSPAVVLSEGLLSRVGECSNTTITEIGTRLQGDPDSGSWVGFENGSTQVSYDAVEGIQKSREGDPVRMCVVAVEEGCPKDRDPLREFQTTNLRTQRSWTLGNHSHSCRGA
jgi:hypothetical protein